MVRALLASRSQTGLGTGRRTCATRCVKPHPTAHQGFNAFAESPYRTLSRIQGQFVGADRATSGSRRVSRYERFVEFRFSYRSHDSKLSARSRYRPRVAFAAQVHERSAIPRSGMGFTTPLRHGRERSNVINSNSQTTAGEMAEWFKAHAWKACVL
jgi:hypothetical protein